MPRPTIPPPPTAKAVDLAAGVTGLVCRTQLPSTQKTQYLSIFVGFSREGAVAPAWNDED